MLHKVKPGESPAKIARAYGVPMSSLLRSNPTKPIVGVGGQETWRDLRVGETIVVGVGYPPGEPGQNPCPPGQYKWDGVNCSPIKGWEMPPPSLFGCPAGTVYEPISRLCIPSYNPNWGGTWNDVVERRHNARERVGMRTDTRTGAAPSAFRRHFLSDGTVGADPIVELQRRRQLEAMMPSGGIIATAAGAYTPAQMVAAGNMNNALLAHGYKLADQPLYKAFQTAMGLVVDGFPGPNTMTALRNVLGAATAPVKVYSWQCAVNGLNANGSSCYDGIHAPPYAEWAGGVGPMPPVPPVTPPVVCPPGTNFNPAVNRCTPIAVTCPQGQTYNQATGKCEASGGLSTGAIVAGAAGLAAVVGVIAYAATGKKSRRKR